ncbi:hypothetical protein [Streptomyces sp. LS1784]|uniref:hypothetical protein n=1 Tax=Streptomyces sp. LS1784 TaxID=2851533 RepID=UPI001CCA8DE7|nr:hypothetical protein [Streptomyces sp. LS1784]
MTAQSYEEYEAAYAHEHGLEQARQNCPPYMRYIAAQLRQMANEEANPVGAEALRRRADRMDPDLRRDPKEAADAPAG